MTELRPSLAQQEFIAKEIRHRRQVVIVRFMLLVLPRSSLFLFSALWMILSQSFLASISCW